MIKSIFFYSLRASVFLVFAGFLWVMGLVLFTHTIPSAPQGVPETTDGIAIFTGGKTRLALALSLFQEKKAKYLLISGVNPQSTLPQKVARMPLKSRVTLGYSALDTVGNARETESWVKKHKIKTLRLITSNYHMPRSLLELKPLLPNVRLYPHPVVGKKFLDPKWWLDPPTFHLVVHEYNKFLFAFFRRGFEDIQGILMGKDEEKS